MEGEENCFHKVLVVLIQYCKSYVSKLVLLIQSPLKD